MYLYFISTYSYALSNQTTPINNNHNLVTKENTPREINLVKSSALNNTNLNLHFNLTQPWHGNIINKQPNLTNLYTITYKPKLNYTGTDNFTFYVYDNINKDKNYRGYVSILVTTPFDNNLIPAK